MSVTNLLMTFHVPETFLSDYFQAVHLADTTLLLHTTCVGALLLLGRETLELLVQLAAQIYPVLEHNVAGQFRSSYLGHEALRQVSSHFFLCFSLTGPRDCNEIARRLQFLISFEI